MNKIRLLHQVGISSYLMKKMHGQTTLKFDNYVHNVPQQVPVFVIRINSTLLCHTLCIRVHQIVLFIFTIQNNQGMNNKHKPPLTTKNQSGYMRK